jgi:hypothetical protein
MTFVVLMIASASSAQEDGRTVAELLADCGCIVPGMPASMLEKRVATAQQLTDEQGFVIAFFASPAENAKAFEVIAGNAQLAQWKHASFSVEHRVGDPRFWDGQLWSISRAGPFTLVGLRVAIAGIATSILTSDLVRVGITYGLVKSVFPSGLVMFQRAQPHFAPTHYVELAVLDTTTGVERDIYPVKPFDRVRRDMIRQERERYAALGKQWCMEMNHHCNPERFDSDLAPPPNVVTNEQTHSAAFRVEYGQGVVVVCTGIDRLAAISCHESPFEAWRRAFPKLPDDELIRRAAANPHRVSWR